MTDLCPVCGDPKSSSRVVCTSCLSRLVEECFDSFMARCPVCHYPLLDPLYRCDNCLGGGGYDIFSIADYNAELSYSILRSMKFHGKISYVPIMAYFIKKALGRLDPDCQAVIVPIPCSKARLKENGWDQMLEAARLLGRPYVKALGISGQDLQMKALGREDRLLKAPSRFTVDPSVLERACPDKDHKIIVIDDVCTTMASMKAAIDLVRSCGYTDVSGVSWLLDYISANALFCGDS